MLSEIKLHALGSIGVLEILKSIDWSSENLGLILQLLIATITLIRVIFLADRPIKEALKPENLKTAFNIFKLFKTIRKKPTQETTNEKNKENGTDSKKPL